MTIALRSVRRGLPIGGTLAAVALLLAIVLNRIELRTDMTDLLPRGGTEAERFLLDEIRTGPATGVILLGIEGAPPGDLARISRAMGAALRSSGRFELVGNGDAGLSGNDPAEAGEVLFRYRYLLADADFAVPALRDGMRRALLLLQSSAAPLAGRFGLADPPGAFPALLRDWSGTGGVRSVEGVWFAGGRERALILAKMRAAGMDFAAEEQAVAAIQDAFAAAGPGGARLLAAGPALFSRDAANGIRADIRLLSVASTLLIALLLLWRFRSPWVIGAIAIPVVLGLAVAALVVQAVFGFVHGIALGFGMTMLGVTVDYPVLLIGHRKQRETAPATLRRIGRAFTLAVLTAALGLTGMLFSGFPGLAQLGLFSVAGLLAAAAATRWLLPRLIVAADLAPVSAGAPDRLLRIERLRRLRGAGALACAAAALYLLLAPPGWSDDLAALTPVPPAALALDAALRGELGAPDSGQIAMVRGPTAEAVLRREEALLPVLDRLRDERLIGGVEIAARFLPSAARQQARQAALPEPAELAGRLEEAAEGLPFRAGAFQPFLDDVATSRVLAPLTLADLPSGAIGRRVAALLIERGGGWVGLIAPSGVRDAARVRAALEPAGADYVDLGAAANGIVATYTASALRWLGIGAALAAAVLLVGLGDWRRALLVAASVAASVLLTVALLTLAGQRLSLVTIVSLQFVAGIGLDYALFFARRQLDAEERARTLRTLATCNAMTVMTFGLLAFCRTQLLRDIGQTVVAGAIAALVFAFLFAGPRPGAEPG